MNQLLRHDMEQVGKHYGTDAVTCRTFDTLGDIDVELHIDVSFLEVRMIMNFDLWPVFIILNKSDKNCGTDFVRCGTFDTLGYIDVELHIDVSFLEVRIIMNFDLWSVFKVLNK